MLNPTHLATLQKVLDRGSFVAAAEDLGYTPSAVSQQMGALESATGLVLFERLPRSVKPTPAALYLADGGKEVVSTLRSLERDARALAAATLGEIRLGSFRTACAGLLPGVLTDFRASHPAVDVHLDEAEPEQLTPAVLDGTLDIALVYDNDLDLHTWPAGLVQTPLLIERRLLLLPPRLTRSRGSVRLASLRRETWIASKPSPSLVRFCAQEGFEPNITLRTNDYYSICEFVRAGLGVALVPELGHYLAETLRPHALSPSPPRRHVFALHRSSNSNPLLGPMLDTLHRAVRARTPQHA